MADAISSHATERYAVVTGGNKGIGLEICRQLASKEVTVVLTARDEKRGIEALESLKSSAGLSDHLLVFHQLDVTSPASIACLFDFINTKFGKLDILVNNAGIIGAMVEGDILLVKEIIETEGSRILGDSEPAEITANGTLNTTYEWTEQCLQTNYYGTKRMVEAFVPLLKLSDAPRLVNVASSLGSLKLLSNEWAIRVLSDADNLTEDRIDGVLNQFLKDFEKGSSQAKGWPTYVPAYKVSKACLIAYTRVLAKKYPTAFRINSVCPGFVKTDINFNTGSLTVEEGAESPVKLALLPDDGPSGLFFYRGNVTSF